MNNTTKVWVLFLCVYFLTITLLFSQSTTEWQIPHAELNSTYFTIENSQPNPTHFGNMIGTAGGKEIGNYFNPQFEAAGVINSFRSFHLMEADFGDAFFPKEKELSTISCDCGDVLYSCEEDRKCEDEYLPYNTYGFRGYKAHYCDWSNDPRFGIKEIYAALEAQIPIKAAYCNTTVNGECIEEYENPCLIQDGRDQTDGRKFPNKWYTSDEWGGHQDSIQKHARNYVYHFAATFCPTDYEKDCVVKVLELGNEPWGLETPGKLGYHAILKGAVQALKELYGTDKDNWRMKLSTAAFDARFACDNAPMQYIDDMIPNDPEIKKYIDYLNVHNYPFTNTPCGVPVDNLKLNYTPESPDGGFLSFKNMEVWKRQNSMEHARINMTEFGWNSSQEDCNSGIGEANQAAYHMRAYLLAARHGIHKGFSYCLRDQPKYIWNGSEYSPESPLYCSTGLIDRNGNKKASFYATETFVKKIGQKHFLKAIEEKHDKEGGIFAYLLGEVDELGNGIPTHLVAWRASDLGVSDNQNIQYPTTDSELGRGLTTLTLPSTDMDFSIEDNYFYLGWDEENPRLIGDQVVNQIGVATHQINVDLSGLPIVIPINPVNTGYDKEGNLFGGELAEVISANDLEASLAFEGGDATINQVEIASFNCGDMTITYGNGQIKMEGIEGISYPRYEIIDITNNQYLTVFKCQGNNCGAIQIADNLPTGNYLVKVFSPDWGLNCEIAYGTPIKLKANTTPDTCIDTDSDGVCDTDDCSPLNPSYPMEVGSACDDGDSNTFGDKIMADGCHCEGTIGKQINCGEITITYGKGEIRMDGAPDQAYFFTVQDMANGWAEVFSCWNNCGASQIVQNLPTSKYSIKVYGKGNTCHQIIKLKGNEAVNASSRSILELASYMGNGEIQLEWVANHLEITEGFLIEKSMDGIHFNTLKYVGKLGLKDFYKEKDKAPGYGENFYRIKQELEDGSYRYSAISRETYFLNENDITIFPNPVKETLWLNLRPNTNLNGSVTIFNSLGQPIISNVIEPEQKQMSFDVATFKNGIYYLVIMEDGKKLFTKRFVLERWY